MRFLNLRINFYLLRTFCPHLSSFCVVSSFTTFWPNFTSGLLQVILPRIECWVCLPHYKFGTDPNMEDQIRRTNNWIYKTKKSILDRPSEPVAQQIEALSLYGSRWALSEDSCFKSYPSRPEVYVKNVVR